MTPSIEEIKLKRIKSKVEELKKFYKHLIVYVIINTLFALSSNFTEINFHIFSGYKITNLWIGFDNFKIYPLWFVWGIFLVLNSINVFAIPMLLGDQWETRKVKEFMKKEKTKNLNNI